MRNFYLTVIAFFCCYSVMPQSVAGHRSNVIAYYSGPPTIVDSFAIEKITHIIFSFGHLKGDSMIISNGRDSSTITKLVALKARNPKLKVMLSMGGWGGCATCSEVFSNEGKRKVFAQTVRDLSDYFHTDGIDLDWEYPATPGFPGHLYSPDDRPNFTKLMKQLRKTLGKNAQISFAAGGQKEQFDSSFEWTKVMRYADRVNLMSYDLVSGYAAISGHHTPLYSTPQQTASVDYGVRYLEKLGVPANKIAIGAAFYARVFANTIDVQDGLYQPTHFLKGVSYKDFGSELAKTDGYVYYWDPIAQAPYLYNQAKQYFVTFDDPHSIQLKTQYVVDKGLNGIMFWQLTDDAIHNGLLDVIDSVMSKP